MTRTLTLGIAVAVGVGATLLGPSSATVAADALTCEAETLTEPQLNHLLVDINAATVAQAATVGYRSTSRTIQADGTSVTTVATKDAASGWFDQVTTTTGQPTKRFRYVWDSVRFDLISTSDPKNRPGLAVLGRSSFWLKIGMSYADDLAAIMRPPTQRFMVRRGGTCSASEAGLTLVFTENGKETTVVTNPALAMTSSTSTKDGVALDTVTIVYRQIDVFNVFAVDRVSTTDWARAQRSAVMRAALITYAKKVAARAEAAADKANRAVRSTDVKAVTLTPPTGSKRSNLTTGISVTAPDAYTGGTLRITVTVAQQKVLIGDNW